MNLLKNLVIGKNVFNCVRLSPQLVQVQFYSKNTKTHRKKEPHQAKQTQQWVSNVKTKYTLDEVDDKLFLERKIVDPVWLMNEYKVQTFQIEEAISFHKELAKPEMFNNMDGFLNVRLLLDFTTKKKTKFMDNVKGSVYFPHYFKEGIKKEVVVVCKKEAEIEAARKAGALIAGYEEVLKKLEKGELTDQSYDIIVCTPEVFPEVALLKKKIHKDKMPSVKTNTVTENIADLVYKLHLSRDYESSKLSDEKGILKAKIGPLNFTVEQLTENLGALVEKILSHKKINQNDFVSNCVLFAPPSTEKFKVDINRYYKTEETKETKQSEASSTKSADSSKETTDEKETK